MKLIVGLGNPGKEYQATRHNLGFMIVDEIAQQLALANFSTSSKFKSDILETSRQSEKIILLKPATFMNNSGQAVGAVARFYHLPLEDIWVVYDELAISFGRMRVRQGGSSAGHNGIKSIIEAIGQDFRRFRVGINNERSDEITNEKFVLSQFNEPEKKQLTHLCARASQIVIGHLQEDTLSTSYDLLR